MICSVYRNTVTKQLNILLHKLTDWIGPKNVLHR